MRIEDKSQNEEIAIQLGENLRRLRRREGMSQEELAKRAALHRTEIGLIERGQRLIRVDTMVKLVGALSEAEAAALLEGIEWMATVAHPGQFRVRPRGER